MARSSLRASFARYGGATWTSPPGPLFGRPCTTSVPLWRAVVREKCPPPLSCVIALLYLLCGLPKSFRIGKAFFCCPLLVLSLQGCHTGSNNVHALARDVPRAALQGGTGQAHVRMDCQGDEDCGHRGEVVCHRAVMGGTCAPRCEDDARCAGVVPGLVCVGGWCVPASPDGGLQDAH